MYLIQRLLIWKVGLLLKSKEKKLKSSILQEIFLMNVLFMHPEHPHSDEHFLFDLLQLQYLLLHSFLVHLHVWMPLFFKILFLFFTSFDII